MLEMYNDLIYSEENKYTIVCPYLNTKALENMDILIQMM